MNLLDVQSGTIFKGMNTRKNLSTVLKSRSERERERESFVCVCVCGGGVVVVNIWCVCVCVCICISVFASRLQCMSCARTRDA